MQKYKYHSSKGWKGIDSIPCRTAPAQYFVASKRAFHKNIQLPYNRLTQDGVLFDAI